MLIYSKNLIISYIYKQNLEYQYFDIDMMFKKFVEKLNC